MTAHPISRFPPDAASVEAVEREEEEVGEEEKVVAVGEEESAEMEEEEVVEEEKVVAVGKEEAVEVEEETITPSLSGKTLMIHDRMRDEKIRQAEKKEKKKKRKGKKIT